MKTGNCLRIKYNYCMHYRNTHLAIAFRINREMFMMGWKYLITYNLVQLPIMQNFLFLFVLRRDAEVPSEWVI